MDPQGVKVQGFKQPTPEEQAHDFLWRVHPHAPAKGEVAVFNRSHYEDVLVVRVHKLVPKPVWKARYDFINEWERLLPDDNNTTILKFFLYISKDEQLASASRSGSTIPARQWKISDSDYKERDYWDDYIDAFEDALTHCSTKHAPWYVIPSNHKWFRNLAVSQIIADTMEDMNLKLPKPTVDLAKIRKLYHAQSKDETKERGGKKTHATRVSTDDGPDALPSPAPAAHHALLDSAPMGRRQYAIWLLASGGTLLDGFSIFSLGVAMPLVTRQFTLSPLMVGLIGVGTGARRGRSARPSAVRPPIASAASPRSCSIWRSSPPALCSARTADAPLWHAGRPVSGRASGSASIFPSAPPTCPRPCRRARAAGWWSRPSRCSRSAC